MVDGLAARFPGDVLALDLAAKLRQSLGDTQEAVKIWEQCLAQDPDFAEASVSIGKVRFEAGDFSRAEAVLRPVVARAPDNAEASFVLASSLFSQGKTAETVQVLENSRAATTATVANEVLLGQAYLRLRQHDRAKACFLTATQQASEYPNAYFGLAAACDALGQADEAALHRRKFRELQAAQLRQSIEQTGRYDDVRSTRQDIANFYLAAGRLCLAHGDAAAAEQHAKQALELAPDNEQGRAELAQLYVKTGRLQEAVDVLLPLKTTRARDASFWQRLAQLYAQLQAFEEADEALRRIVELAPEQALGYAGRAQLRLQSNRDPAEAAEFAKQAVERTPTAANYFLWSVACQRAGDPARAKTAIEKALELDPGNAQYQQLYLSLAAKR
jgi:cellulose synthase operon protein C